MSQHQLDPEQARRLLASAAGAFETRPDGFDRIRVGYRRRRLVRRASAVGVGAIALSSMGLALFEFLPTSGTSTHLIVPAGGPSPGANTPPTAPTGSAATPEAAAPPPGCATSDLQVTVKPSGAAAGTSYVQVVFLNRAGRPCVLRGYPGVSFTDPSGKQLGQPAREGPIGGAQVSAVTLKSGQTATAFVGLPDTANYPPAACNQAAATDMRVYPPNETIAVLVPLTTEVCTAAEGMATVGPVQPGQA